MKSKKSIRWVGMINTKKQLDHLGYNIQTSRAFLIDNELEKNGFKLICYSPENIDREKRNLKGFIIDNGAIREINLPIPIINYDFCFGPKERNSYLEYEKWANSEKIKIYPIREFRILSCDKYESFNFISKLEPELTPKTEKFDKDEKQLSAFLKAHNMVFIKPRYGNKGDGILVLKRNKKSFLIERYFKNKVELYYPKNISGAISYLIEKTRVESYIIQEAINVMRYNDSVFDIRVILFMDMEGWRLISELRLGSQKKRFPIMHREVKASLLMNSFLKYYNPLK